LISAAMILEQVIGRMTELYAWAKRLVATCAWRVERHEAAAS
jgi:hypothetical protein